MGIDLFDVLGFSITSKDKANTNNPEQASNKELVWKYPEIFGGKPGKANKHFELKPTIDGSVLLFVERMHRVPQMVQEKPIRELKMLAADEILVKVDSAPCV